MERGAGLHSCKHMGIVSVAQDAAQVVSLVEDNLNLVYFVARRYKHMGIEFEDLVAEGRVGLVVAARRYDPSLVASFGTFAFNYIRGRIANAVASKSQTIRRPWKHPGRARRPIIPVCSLGAFSKEAFPTDDWQAVRDIEQAVDQPKVRALVDQALGTLTGRELFVVRKTFGFLNSGQPQTLDQAAAVLGITRQGAEKIRIKALQKLRRRLNREVSLN